MLYLDSTQSVTDGLIDQVEDQVNSVQIIDSDKIFRLDIHSMFISTMQIYESYMPTNMSVTSYGHVLSPL